MLDDSGDAATVSSQTTQAVISEVPSYSVGGTIKHRDDTESSALVMGEMAETLHPPPVASTFTVPDSPRPHALARLFRRPKALGTGQAALYSLALVLGIGLSLRLVFGSVKSPSRRE